MHLIRCDVFEKKIDGIRGLHGPPIKIGGFKMIDVSVRFLIAQVGFIRRLLHQTLIINTFSG
jgi:hypothetical protein